MLNIRELAKGISKRRIKRERASGKKSMGIGLTSIDKDLHHGRRSIIMMRQALEKQALRHTRKASRLFSRDERNGCFHTATWCDLS